MHFTFKQTYEEFLLLFLAFLWKKDICRDNNCNQSCNKFSRKAAFTDV